MLAWACCDIIALKPFSYNLLYTCTDVSQNDYLSQDFKADYRS